MSIKFGSFRLLSAGAIASSLIASAAVGAYSAPGAQAAVAATRIAPVKLAAAPPTDQNGYAWISYYRGLAGLAPVSRSAKLEAQDAVHIRYLANSSLPCETNVHDEQTKATAGCPVNRAATAAGKAAANNSDVTRVSVQVSDRQAVSEWFGAAFHALTLLDPRLQVTGYAAYYTPKPAGAQPLAWPFTAAADVYNGRTGSYNGGVVAFPANGSTTPLLSYQLGTESPEPFREANANACAGWSGMSTVSSPVIVQWPIATGVPRGAATIIDLSTGTRQPTCGLTGTSYPAGSLPAQFLNGANGITKSGFYYASTPFQPGHRYQLQIGGRAVTTFTATNVPTRLSAAVGKGGTPGSAKFAVSNNDLTRRLYQVWSGPNCTGALTQQRWAAPGTSTVNGLNKQRTYSVRWAGVNRTGGSRWSACMNFRPT